MTRTPKGKDVPLTKKQLSDRRLEEASPKVKDEVTKIITYIKSKRGLPKLAPKWQGWMLTYMTDDFPERFEGWTREERQTVTQAITLLYTGYHHIS